jgi:hypothetical protein
MALNHIELTDEQAGNQNDLGISIFFVNRINFSVNLISNPRRDLAK